MTQRSDLVFTVDLCPRCGMQHDDLSFDKMGSSIAGSSVQYDEDQGVGGYTTFTLVEFDLFATCPTKAEPILGRIVGEGEVEVR